MRTRAAPALHANVPCVDRQAGGAVVVAVGVARPLPWWAAAGSRAGCRARERARGMGMNVHELVAAGGGSARAAKWD